MRARFSNRNLFLKIWKEQTHKIGRNKPEDGEWSSIDSSHCATVRAFRFNLIEELP